jgi:hypothetical protein
MIKASGLTRLPMMFSVGKVYGCAQKGCNEEEARMFFIFFFTAE